MIQDFSEKIKIIYFLRKHKNLKFIHHLAIAVGIISLAIFLLGTYGFQSINLALYFIASINLGLFITLSTFFTIFWFSTLKFSVKDYLKLIFTGKKDISPEYLKKNFASLYPVFEHNNKVSMFKSFFNLVISNKIEDIDYQIMYETLTHPNFVFSTKNSVNNEWIEPEKNFDFLVKQVKNGKLKSNDLTFFE